MYNIYIYIYLYISVILSIYIYSYSKVEGENHPSVKLCCRRKEVLINKVFDLAHKENIKKTGEVFKNQGSYHSHCKYCETVTVKVFH